MRVSNWTKWTRFKKRVVLLLLVIGIPLGLGVEGSNSMTGGYIGLVLVLWASFIFSTIDFD